MTEKRLQEKNVEEVTRKRRTTIDENEKYDEIEYQEEASRGGDFRRGRMLQEESLEQGSDRSVPWERLKEEHATGRRSKRRKLQEVEALGIKDSMRWALHKEALGGERSRSRKLQEDLPPGGSRRRRLL